MLISIIHNITILIIIIIVVIINMISIIIIMIGFIIIGIITITTMCARPHPAGQARPVGDGQAMLWRLRIWPRLSPAPISLRNWDSGSI